MWFWKDRSFFFDFSKFFLFYGGYFWYYRGRGVLCFLREVFDFSFSVIGRRREGTCIFFNGRRR